MEATLFLKSLRDSNLSFNQVKDMLNSLHTMTGSQIRVLPEGVPNSLTENGFLMLADSAMSQFANAQADLELVIALLEELQRTHVVSSVQPVPFSVVQ